MPANADNCNVEQRGHHPSKPQQTRNYGKLAAGPPTTPLTHGLMGRMVALARKELCWTQEELAEKSGYDVKTIQNVESGRTKKPDTLRDLRDCLTKELARRNLQTLEELLTSYQQRLATQPPEPLVAASKHDNWQGMWFCRWSPRKPNDNGWITEKVRLSHKAGKLRIELVGPAEEYRWEAWARVKGTYLIGEWRSLRLHSTSRGAVQLTVNNQGTSLLGYFVGPHIDNRMTIFRFILAENKAELERVTKDFKKLI